MKAQLSESVALLVIFTTLIILILVLGIISGILHFNRRSIRQAAALSLARAEYESELRKIESEVQELTLGQMAEEMHDNIGQLLFALKLQLEHERSRYGASGDKLDSAISTLRLAIDQVRLLSHSLNADLVGNGIVKSVSKELERVRLLGRMEIVFDCDGTEPELSKDARVTAFRIFQEAITNAMKHAEATRLRIVLNGQPHFQLEISDNGVGFDLTQALENRNGLGLTNILKRAEIVGLQCRLESAPRLGSTLSISKQA